MGLGSVILGIFAFLLMIAGVIFVWVPFLGTMLSFLSPILAIAGVILGGVAMSRAKQGMGESEGLATAGLVLNIIAFVPAMLVALTCGLCNTMCTGAFLTPPDSTHSSVPWDRDGGRGSSDPLRDLFEPPDAAVPGVPVPGAPVPGVPVPGAPVPTPPPTEPMQREGDSTPLPPPPLPAGPSGGPSAAPSPTAPTAPIAPIAPTAPTAPDVAPAPSAPAATDPPTTPATPDATEATPRRRRASH